MTAFGGGEGFQSREDEIVGGLLAFRFFREGGAKRTEADGEPGAGPTRTAVLPEMIGVAESGSQVGFATSVQAEEGQGGSFRIRR